MRRILLPTLLLLSACSVGPDFLAPEPEAPATWNDPSANATNAPGHSNITTDANPDPQWWTGFNDPELTSLVQRAVSGNLTLQEDVLRITEARQQEISAEAAGLPHLGGKASYAREQEGLKGLVRESSGGFSSGSASSSTSSGSGSGSSFDLAPLYKPLNLFQDSLNASWELDLFGRVSRSAEEARANTVKAVEDHNDALVSLEAQVGQAYTQFRGAQAQESIAAEDIKVEQDILQLTQRRYKQGLSSFLDVDNAETQLDTTTAGLPQFQQQERVAANELCLLLGLPPGALDTELESGATVPTLPPDIAIGMPSQFAMRRSDVRSAIAQLHAATAALGVAVAQTYPDITLTGEAGTRSLEIQDLVHWANLFYSAGPQISLPIFEGGELTANIDLATADQAEAALNYQQTVLTGLEQVENALSAYRTDRARQLSLQQTVKAAEDGLYLARNRYEHGLSNFIDVLTTENQLVTARQQYTDAATSVTEDVVTIYRSLGGGWENQPFSQPPAPEADKVLEHVVEQ
jgi:NodT family efflux transporter outer membrane factor (OMF) lipoprotein